MSCRSSMSEARRAVSLAVALVVCLVVSLGAGGTAAAAPLLPAAMSKNAAKAILAPYEQSTPQWATASWRTSGCTRSSSDFDFGQYLAGVSLHSQQIYDAYTAVTGAKNVGGILNPFFYFQVGRVMKPAAPAPIPHYCVSEISNWARHGPRQPGAGGAPLMPTLHGAGGFMFDCSGAQTVSYSEGMRCRTWDAWATSYRRYIRSLWYVNASGHDLICYQNAFNPAKCYDSRLAALWGSIKDAPGYLAKKGMQQVSIFFAQYGAKTFTMTSGLVGGIQPNLRNSGFVFAYNLVAGVMLALVGAMFLISLIIAMIRSGAGLGRTVFGALSAVFGITTCGAIATLIVGLGSACTQELISHFNGQLDASQISNALQHAPDGVGLVAGLFMLVGALLTLLMLVILLPLTYAHALLGSAASVGQAVDGTRHWLKDWLMKLIALAFTPFFIMAMWILAIGLVVQPTNLTASLPNSARDTAVALVGAALMLLLPFTPKLLLSSFQFFDHRVGAMHGSITRGGRSAGGAVLSGGAHGVKSSAGVAAGAVATMMTNLHSLSGRRAGSGSTGRDDADGKPAGSSLDAGPGRAGAAKTASRSESAAGKNGQATGDAPRTVDVEKEGARPGGGGGMKSSGPQTNDHAEAGGRNLVRAATPEQESASTLGHADDAPRRDEPDRPSPRNDGRPNPSDRSYTHAAPDRGSQPPDQRPNAAASRATPPAKPPVAADAERADTPSRSTPRELSPGGDR